jgi:hypothetical protein
VSRQREYLADATAADLLRDPQSMVNALRRIDGDQTNLRRFEVATAHLWFEEPNDTRGPVARPRWRAGSRPTRASRSASSGSRRSTPARSARRAAAAASPFQSPHNARSPLRPKLSVEALAPVTLFEIVQRPELKVAGVSRPSPLKSQART